MVPAIELNGLAIAAAVLAIIVVGFVWYGPLFGDAWMKEMGVAPGFKPDPAVLKKAMLLMVIGAVFTSVVLACAIAICRPSTWDAGTDAVDAAYGLCAALCAWAGFYLPMLLGGVAWENRSWTWFRINAGYHGAALLAAAMILAFWH